MAIANTTLEVGIVQVPVSINKVAEKQEATLDRATKNGNPIKRVERDGVTGEVVDADFPAVHGVFDDPKAKQGFHEIPADLLKEIEEATKLDALAVEAFIPLSEVPQERIVGCYYLTAQKGANPKSLKILHDALKARNVAGVFKVVLKTRQQPAIVYAKNGGLYVNTMVWAEDWHRAERVGEQLAEVVADPKMVAMATDLIDAMTEGPDVLDTLTDDLRPKREALIADALKGKHPAKKAAKAKAKAAQDEDPLAAALKASVAAAAAKKKSSKKVAVAA